MRRWLIERSWRRLIALWSVAYLLVFAVSWFAAETANVTIVAGAWAWIVFFQAALQLGTTALSDYVTAKPEEEHGAALATFALSLAALAALLEVALGLAITPPTAWSERANKTILGAIACAADGATCGDTFRNTIIFLAIVLIPAFCWATFLLRRQSIGAGSSGAAKPTVEGPFVLASVAIAFTFLAVHEWRGVVQVNPPPSLDPLSEELRAANSNLLIFRGVGWAAILSLCILQGLAMWMALGIYRDSRGRTEALSRSVLAAAKRVATFGVFLLVDLLLIAAIVTAISAIVVAIVFGTWNLIEALLFALTFIASASVEAVRSIGGPATPAVVESIDYGPGLAGSIETAAQIVGGVGLLAIVGLIAWGGFRAVVNVAKAIGQAILSFLGWLLELLLTVATKRETWLTAAVLVGACAIFFGPRTRVSDAGTTPEEVIPSYPSRHEFKPVRVDCSAAADSERLRWAFDSSENIVLPMDGCGVVFEDNPATILVLGAASGDDTRQGGFTLSSKRGEAVAREARRQFPKADIVIATLGREQLNLPSMRDPDIFSYGRPLMIFASTAEIPTPLRREPLSKAVTDLLKEHGIFDRYETCILSQYEIRPVPKRFPYAEANEGCRWSKEITP